ncbi:MAG TPA: TIM barrel protein [Methanomassiliicoccales archaeon]|jgi:deoxyribonuclease-4
MVRFGPAGYPKGAKDGAEAVGMVREAGLDALELQFGRQVNLSDQRAEAIRRKAEETDVMLSAHAPYYISFNSVPETYEKSKEWVMRTARAAAKAGAWIIVIHAATYAGKEPEIATAAVMRGLSECLEQMEKESLDVVLGLETMGRGSTWGTLEEIGTVTRALKGVQPVIDFAHIHARYGGSLRTEDDFRKVMDELTRIWSGRLHCHYSCIEYTRAGEKRHLPLSAKDPDFSHLVPSLFGLERECTIICETPLPVEDALAMSNEYGQTYSQEGHPRK